MVTLGASAAGLKDQVEDGERIAFLDQALWAALLAESPGTKFAVAWLTLLCRQLKDVERGLLVLRGPDGELSPAARWPDGDRGSSEIAQAVALCLEHKQGVANVNRASAGRDAAQTSAVAYPVSIGGQVQAIVGIETLSGGDVAARELMRGLRWSAGWLELAFLRGKNSDLAARLSRTTIALEIVALIQGAKGFDHQARVFATELANRSTATRVAVGWIKRRSCRVIAVSHGIAFSKRMELIVKIADAMDEAADQAQTVMFPPPETIGALVTRAHAALLQKTQASVAISVPLVAQDKIAGVLLAEFDSQTHPAQQDVDLLEAVAALAAPALDTSRAAERNLFIHAYLASCAAAARLFGAGHLGLKLASFAVIALTVFFALFKTEYRISARATVEGEVRRTIAASIDGYVASEHARAGQSVKEGSVLASLDATEFKLQRLRAIAVREQHQLELSKNLAAGQRADVNILGAQIDEAEAQIALLDDEIARTTITAPFDGIVLSGDLSQSIGAPVQRAQTLFEIAPLDAYRVILRIPDFDIDRVKPGDHGTLTLSALPDDRFSFAVTAITPVAEVSDGQNAFRVEGRLETISERLRPNMEGVTRVDVGQERLIWIWTHHLIEAVRIAIWSWWP